MTAERESLLLRGVLDLCVLSLMCERPCYGYEIATALSEFGLPAAPGSIYPLLARLERNAIIRAEQQTSPSGPPRKWWSLTPSGRAVLAEGRATWTAMSSAIDTILQRTTTPEGTPT